MGPKVQAHHTVEEAIGQHAGQPHEDGGVTPDGVPSARTRRGRRPRNNFGGTFGGNAVFSEARLPTSRSWPRRVRRRRYGALLLTTAHGTTDLELSGHFVRDKWQTNAEQLIDTMIALLPIESRAQQPD
jgi:hypothetical protein